MRTSLNNIKAIDDHLQGRNLPGDALLFEAQMLLNAGMADDVLQQQETYTIIQQYGRRKIKAEIAAVQEKLVAAPQYQSFMQSIFNLFKKR